MCSIMNTEDPELTLVAFMQHLKKGRPMLTHKYSTGEITTDKEKELVFKVDYDLDNSLYNFTPTAPYLKNVKVGKFKRLSAGEYWALAMVTENIPQ